MSDNEEKKEGEREVKENKNTNKKEQQIPRIQSFRVSNSNRLRLSFVCHTNMNHYGMFSHSKDNVPTDDGQHNRLAMFNRLSKGFASYNLVVHAVSFGNSDAHHLNRSRGKPEPLSFWVLAQATDPENVDESALSSNKGFFVDAGNGFKKLNFKYMTTTAKIEVPQFIGRVTASIKKINLDDIDIPTVKAALTEIAAHFGDPTKEDKISQQESNTSHGLFIVITRMKFSPNTRLMFEAVRKKPGEIYTVSNTFYTPFENVDKVKFLYTIAEIDGIPDYVNNTSCVWLGEIPTNNTDFTGDDARNACKFQKCPGNYKDARSNKSAGGGGPTSASSTSSGDSISASCVGGGGPTSASSGSGDKKSNRQKKSNAKKGGPDAAKNSSVKPSGDSA